MIGVFNEKASLMLKLTKLLMVFLVVGVCFIAKAEADNSHKEQSVMQSSAIIEEKIQK
ncbi:MAG: hypothetical protein IJ086_10265 [Clostridium sp.]|nr:hypothetical protein [Clostridium sp.]